MGNRHIVLMTLLLAGCSQQSFQGSNAAASTRSDSKKNGNGTGVSSDPSDITLGDRSETPLCSPNPVSLSFARHNVAEPFQEGFSQWIYYSDNFVVDLKSTQGSYLPVTNYSVDDVLVLLGANETIGQTGGSFKGENVTFNLPDGAMILSDPNRITGQIGKMAPSNDVFNTKVYIHRGRTITVSKTGLPGGADLHINDLKPQGMPVVPYNTISLQDLKSAGYIDDQGQLRIRIGLIPHGHGALSFNLDVRACP